MKVQIVKKANVQSKKQNNACDYMVDEPLVAKK